MIRITVQGINSDTTSAYRYTIAGQPIVVQQEVAALEKFSEGTASAQFAELLATYRPIKALSAANSEMRYHDLTPLDGEPRRLRYWRKGRRGQIDVDGMPCCYVDFKDSHIHVLNGRDMNAQLNLEAVIGLALAVLLAYSSNYCLHASAVSTPAGNIAFIGGSGSGKSTLALDQGEAWRQISDDVLPLRAIKGQRLIEMHADFPQLKLNKACVPQDIPEVKILDLLVRLKAVATDDIEFNEVPLKESLVEVVRHTVAAKFFSAPMMEKHASFARKVSLCVPMVELAYPQEWEQLPELRQHIVEFCGDKLA